MRVMLDTNVLVSLLLFPTPQMTVMMECIFRQHEFLLSSFVLDEFDAVMRTFLLLATRVLRSLMSIDQ